MGFLICFSILIYLSINLCHCEESNSFFNSYLLNQYENTKSILTNNFNEHYRKQRDVETTVLIHDMQQFYLNSASFIFEIENITYILIDNQIYTLLLIQDEFILKPYSILSKAENEILLIKCIDYENGTILLVVFKSGYSNVYIKRKNNWIFMQRVHNVGIVLDAHLFYHYNTLYLFILNSMGSSYVPSTLYKWSGMHFDEIDHVLTTGATSITSFEYINSIIIIITQNPSDFSKAGTIVMKFNNGKLRKLQFLNTNGAEKVLTYVLHGERYIIIFCNFSNIGTVYKWNGNYFMQWVYFEIEMDYKKVSLHYYSNNRPMLFIANTNTATVYDIQYDNFEIIAKVTLANNYEEILDMNTFVLNQSTFIYICGYTEDDYTNMVFISFSLQTNKIDQIHPNSDTIVQCYMDLNERLIFRSNLITNMKYKSNRLLQVDQVAQFNNSLKLKDVTLKNSTVVTEYFNTFYEQNVEPIQQNLKVLKNKMENIKQNIKMLTNNVIITGNLYAKHIKTSSIHTTTINENIWNPNLWFLSSNEQIIEFEVLAPYVRSNHITITHKNSELNKLLFVEENDILEGYYIINSLKSNNLLTTVINKMLPQNIYRKSAPTKIKGNKYIKRIATLKILSTIVNKVEVHEILHLIKAPIVSQNYFPEQVNLINLNFEVIHGISWDKFTYNFIKKDIANIITGDLLINSNLKVNNLVTRTVTGIDVGSLFTITTNQTVSSDMQLTNINVNNIISSNINGLSFKKYAVVFQENNHVTGPVSIKNVFVQEDLVGFNISQIDFDNDKEKFLQIYENYIKIKGNLHITNIVTNGAPEIFYQRKLIDFKFENHYWHKNINQKIPTSIILNEASVLHLNIQFLNNVSLTDFSMNSYENAIYQLRFKNVFVPGNISINYNRCNFFTEALKSNSVKKSGSFKISGYKLFYNLLEINNLQLNILDNTYFDEVIIRGYSYKFTDKVFSNLVIEENVYLPQSYKLETKKINGFTVTDLIKRTAFINEASFSTDWHLRHITAGNVIFQSTSVGDIETITQNAVNLFASQTLNKLSVESILLENVHETVQCNDIRVVEYLSKVVWTNEVFSITDTINFTGTLYIENFHPAIVNSVYIKKISEQYLFHKKIQTIEAIYDFGYIESPFLVTSTINNIDIKNLISSKNDTIHIYTDIFIMTLLISDSVNTKYFNNNINQFIDISKIPLTGFWRNVTVLNDIYLLHRNGNINHILNYVVHVQNFTNVIMENVNFNLISVKNAKILSSKINNINIEEMFNDALTKKHTDQLVVGFNTFRKIYAAGASIHGNANIKLVNDINIRDLNSSLIVHENLQNVIPGSKQFKANIKVNNLKVASTVHNMLPANLVSTHKINSPLLNVHFEQLQITSNLNAVFINDVNVIEKLDGRMLRNTGAVQYIHGQIHFIYVSFTGNTELVSLNNINIKNVVVDTGIQTITGLKKFTTSPDIFGNMKVSFLNGYDVAQEYKNSLLLGNNAQLNNNVIFKSSPNIYANINTFKINNVSITRLIEPLKINTFTIKINPVVKLIEQLDTILAEYSRKLSDNQVFLNLMPAKHVQIPLYDSIGSHHYKIQNNTVLNVLHQKQNDSCIKNSDCDCTTQLITSVYDHASLQLYLTPEIDQHRIFSFNEEDWIINVLAKNANTNPMCRADKEEAYITWVSPSSVRPRVVNISELSHIREVHCFVLHNKAFIIITKMYGTSGVAQILKLAADKNEIYNVQNLTVQHGSNIHVFKTSQDYVLVIGNNYESNKLKGNNAKIYTFNEKNEKFVLLQELPSAGIVSTTGLSVNKEENFIVLAERNAKIQVLNYDKDAYNYFLSQNIYSDSTILEVNTFQVQGSDVDEVILTVITDNGQFFIYSFKYIEGWKLMCDGYIDGLQSLTTFWLKGQRYVLAHSKSRSDILFISIQGIK